MTVNGAARPNLPADINIFFVSILDDFRWLQRSSAKIVNLRDYSTTIKIFTVYFLANIEIYGIIFTLCYGQTMNGSLIRTFI
jgi:hypothetical protein